MYRSAFILILSIFSFAGFSQQDSLPYVVVLGVAQDGGYPQLGCQRNCCNMAWKTDSLKRNVVSLALVDPKEKKWWLIEATPDINKQLQLFSDLTKNNFSYLPAGILITHAHTGHYSGLLHFGKEALNSNQMPLYVMPKMRNFLEWNGPWSQMISLKNLAVNELDPDTALNLSPNITIQTFTVPHRDEFSETTGFRIITPGKKYLFIPDIDKWTSFEKDIVKEVAAVDIAFIDGTFYSLYELPYRNIKEVLHPSIEETINIFKNEIITKNKIRFIHFNHTNPLLNDKSYKEKLKKEGFFIAEQGKFYR